MSVHEILVRWKWLSWELDRWERLRLRILVIELSCVCVLDAVANQLMHCNVPVADNLFGEKEKYKSITDDLDSTFAELTGY
jgi:hypothetical protein